MANKISCIVDTGGTGDYTSLNSADASNFNATGVNLVSNDEFIECICKCTDGNADTAAVDLTGYIASIIHNLTISVALGYYHRGIYPSSGNVYRLEISNSTGLILRNAYTIIDGVVVGIITSNAYQYGILLADETDMTLRNCVIKRVGGTSTHIFGIGIYNMASGTHLIYNNIVFDFSQASNRGIRDSTAGGTSANILNNTFVNCRTAIERANVIMLLQNNIAIACQATAFFGTYAADSGHNMDDFNISTNAFGATWSTGTTDGTTTDKLVHSTATFITDGVQIGSIVKNTTSGTEYATVTAVDSEIQLSLSADIIITGENYSVYKNLYTSAADTAIFAHPSSDDYLLLPITGLMADDSPAYRKGADLSDIFTTDILGNTRVGWDIGAHELPTQTREVDIDTGGNGHYTSLNSAESNIDGATIPKDLVTMDEKLLFSCRASAGAADTTIVAIDASMTTDTTHNFTIQAAANSRHHGVYPTSGNVYRLEARLRIDDSYTQIIGLAIQDNAQTGSHIAVGIYASAITFDSLIIKVTSTSASLTDYGIAFSSAITTTNDCYVRNCIIYYTSYNIGSVKCLYQGEAGIMVYADNNTILGGSIGIQRAHGTLTANNNLVFDCVDCFNGTMTSALNNAYSEGPDPGTGGLDISSYAASDIFFNAAGNNYLLKEGSPVIGKGTNLSNIANPVDRDILGHSRGGSIDIGAHQYRTKTNLRIIAR